MNLKCNVKRGRYRAIDFVSTQSVLKLYDGM